MNRKETTEFLSNLLISEKFSGIGKYWAREVSIDYGTTDVKRVDFMQFEPAGVTSISAIEKGIFTCYEVKSCMADFESGFGRNFIGEKNYFVMSMATYQIVMKNIPHNIGVIVPVPQHRDVYEEYENPTKLDKKVRWKLCTIMQAHQQLRKRSMTELLFCMLRSGH